MKASMYWTYPVRSLAREGQRALLAIVCVTVGVLAIVALQLVGNMVDVSLTGNIRALNGGDLDFLLPRITPQQLAYFGQIEAQGEIAAYTAVATDQGSAQGRRPLARIDHIQVVDPAEYPLAGAPLFAAPGNGTFATALAGTSLVLTQDLAQQLGVGTGDTITLTLADGRPAALVVGGVIRNAGLFQQPQAVIALATYEALRSASAPSLAHDEVYADVPGHSAAAAAAVQQQLLQQFPQADVITTANLLQSNQQEAQGIRAFLQVVGLVTLLIGGMGIVSTMQVLLRRRRSEIAMLKVAGYRRRQLYALFGLEALLLGLAGGLLGAAAGVGASLLLKDVVGNAFALVLPPVVDPLTVGAGIVVGGATALIFGLLPIVQASQMRPLALLRELPEGARLTSRASGGLLILLVLTLFFALALAISQNVMLAGALVLGAGITLGALGLLLSVVIWLLAKLSGLAAVLPRAWRASALLALRNLGRGRARTATTQVALCVGVFGAGVILLVGQGLQAQYAQGSNAINASVVTTSAVFPAVDQQLSHTAGITRRETHPQAGALLQAINGVPANNELNAILGYDLSHGQVPAPPDITLDSGRMLGPQDAGTTNIVVDVQQVDRSLNLALGDRLTLQYTTKFNGTSAGAPALTLTIVGFYTNNTLFAARAGDVIADDGVVTRLAGRGASYQILLHLDPQVADAVLAQLQAQYAGQIGVHNYVEIVVQAETLLKNVILALEAMVLPALLAAFVLIANTVALAMFERRRELGVLKAVGQSSRGVLTAVLAEQGIAALVASLLAMLGALAVTGALGQVGLPVHADLASPLAVGIVTATTVACLLVASGVAWSAVRVRPLAVLRYE
jgi:predicted lysophospholipase L1 biosynthesis ABC-type transport system permease subunit